MLFGCGIISLFLLLVVSVVSGINGILLLNKILIITWLVSSWLFVKVFKWVFKRMRECED